LTNFFVFSICLTILNIILFIGLTKIKYVTILVTVMAGNTRLATAIHVAGMLSFAEQIPMTSEAIAQSCKTNAVVIRRIIGQLTRHGLVEVKMGTGGGSRLTKDASEITLAEIYRALEEGSIFEVPQLAETHNCEVGKIVRPVLADILSKAEQGLVEKLNQITLADVIEKVKEKMCWEVKNG
jgi:Rrf2 family protein